MLRLISGRGHSASHHNIEVRFLRLLKCHGRFFSLESNSTPKWVKSFVETVKKEGNPTNNANQTFKQTPQITPTIVSPSPLSFKPHVEETKHSPETPFSPSFSSSSATPSNREVSHPLYRPLYAASISLNEISRHLTKLSASTKDTSIEEKNHLLQHLFLRRQKSVYVDQGLRDFITNSVIDWSKQETKHLHIQEMFLFLDLASQLGFAVRNEDMKGIVSEIAGLYLQNLNNHHPSEGIFPSFSEFTQVFKVLAKLDLFWEDLPRIERREFLAKLLQFGDVSQLPFQEAMTFVHSIRTLKLLQFEEEMSMEGRDYYWELVNRLLNETSESSVQGIKDKTVTSNISSLTNQIILLSEGSSNKISFDQRKMIFEGTEREWNIMTQYDQSSTMSHLSGLVADYKLIPPSLLTKMTESFATNLLKLSLSAIRRWTQGWSGLRYDWKEMPMELRQSLLVSVKKMIDHPPPKPDRILSLFSFLGKLKIPDAVTLQFQVSNNHQRGEDLKRRQSLAVPPQLPRQPVKEEEDDENLALSEERTIFFKDMIEKGIQLIQRDGNVLRDCKLIQILFGMNLTWPVLTKETQSALLKIMLSRVHTLDVEYLASVMYRLALMCCHSPESQSDEFIPVHHELLRRYFELENGKKEKNTSKSDAALIGLGVYCEWLKTFHPSNLTKILQPLPNQQLPSIVVPPSHYTNSSISHLQYTEKLRTKVIELCKGGQSSLLSSSSFPGTIRFMNEFLFLKSGLHPMDVAIVYSSSEDPKAEIDGKTTKIIAFIEYDGWVIYHNSIKLSEDEVSLQLKDQFKHYLYQHYYPNVPILRIVNDQFL